MTDPHAMDVKEIPVNTGKLTLAVKTWGKPAQPAMLALHGWQDNAATFDKLAPFFPQYYWVAPDLPGHGLSEHRGKGADYAIWTYCAEVMAVADQLGLESFYLLGHSMGGGIANLLCALFPERVKKLILLDVIGTITSPAETLLAQMRKGIEQRNRGLRKPGLYATREEAIAARVKNGVDLESATLLGARGIAASEQGFYWRHDQRLTQKSLLSMSDEQVQPFLKAIHCPVLLLTSSNAVQHQEVIDRRIAQVKNIQVKRLAGGHHQHLVGNIDEVARLMKQFLDEP